MDFLTSCRGNKPGCQRETLVHPKSMSEGFGRMACGGVRDVRKCVPGMGLFYDFWSFCAISSSRQHVERLALLSEGHGPAVLG